MVTVNLRAQGGIRRDFERNPVQGQGRRVICSGVSAHTGTALSVTLQKVPPLSGLGVVGGKNFPQEVGRCPRCTVAPSSRPPASCLCSGRKHR